MFADLFEHSWAYELGGINVVFCMLLCVARNITNLRKDIMLNGMGAINRNQWPVSSQMNDTVVRKALQLHKQLHTNCQTNNTSLEYVNFYYRLALEKRAVVFKISSDFVKTDFTQLNPGCLQWMWQVELSVPFAKSNIECFTKMYFLSYWNVQN